VYFVSLPEERKKKKASRSKMIAIFWNSAKRTTPSHTQTMCIKGEREKKGGKDKKEWPRITHRKKECVELRGTNLPHAGQS
jgi:hypothetical protein